MITSQFTTTLVMIWNRTFGSAVYQVLMNWVFVVCFFYPSDLQASILFFKQNILQANEQQLEFSKQGMR